MPSLEQITQTGIVSLDSNRDLHPVMVSMIEHLVAEEFADETRSEKISIEDAYNIIWTERRSRRVLLFYAGLIDDASELINRLWKEFVIGRDLAEPKEKNAMGYMMTEEESKYKDLVDRFTSAAEAVLLAAECYNASQKTDQIIPCKREIAREISNVYKSSRHMNRYHHTDNLNLQLRAALIRLGRGDPEILDEMISCSLEPDVILSMASEQEQALRYVATQLKENKILATSIYPTIDKIGQSACKNLVGVLIDMVDEKYGSGFSQEEGSYGASYAWYSYSRRAFLHLARFDDPRAVDKIRGKLTELPDDPRFVTVPERYRFAAVVSDIKEMSEPVRKLIESLKDDPDERFVEILNGEPFYG